MRGLGIDLDETLNLAELTFLYETIRFDSLSNNIWSTSFLINARDLPILVAGISSTKSLIL